MKLIGRSGCAGVAVAGACSSGPPSAAITGSADIAHELSVFTGSEHIDRGGGDSLESYD